MPIYDIYHIMDLSMEQRDKLAEGITRIHSDKFTTPKLFVNVVFHDHSTQHTYVGGKRRSTNRIVATVRQGPSRTQDQWADVCAEVQQLWDEVVPDVKENPRKELRATFILGSLIAGAEAGFVVPQAGDDRNWLERNMEAFKEKADSGDQDFADMLTEVKQRDAFKGLVGDWKSPEEIKKEKQAKKEKEKDAVEAGEELPDRSKEPGAVPDKE